MKRLCGLLALFCGLLLCASAVFARGSLATWPHTNNPIPGAAATACTLDVALVTFLDASSANTTPNHGNYDYHDHDRPYGEVSGRLTAASYRRHDFLRMLAGGYDDGGGHPTPFVGDTVTVANSDTLPEVFGSVRAYFDSVSNGAFQLHVRIVNPPATGTGDFPRWIELPNTKEHYAESTMRNEFWNAAYQATLDSLSSSDTAWHTGISLPHHDEADYPFSRLLRRKLLFLYSGVVFDNRASQLHPRVDRITNETPTPPVRVPGRPAEHTVGYRYVTGERQGFGNTDRGVDEFTGIGMHAHEIGHLLGLWHGEGNWTDPNRYGTERRLDRYGNTAAPNNAVTEANQLGWTLMQGGGDQGPIMDEGYNPNGYYIAYRSCPNPINPFYLLDLGWLTPTEIRGPQNDYRIDPGTTHRIDRGAVEFLLNRRTVQPFGGRYVSFYDYTAENAVSQGLMIWRRTFRADPSRQDRQDVWQSPILIVADGRRYRDARDQDQNPNIPEYYDMLSDPFASGRIEAPDGYDEFDQDNVSAVSGLNAGAGLRQATSGFNRDLTSLNLALTNITYDSTTDTIMVDIYMARPSPPTNVRAVVSNGQMTLDWEAPSDPGPPPGYRYRQSTDGTWGRPIDVAETGVPIGRLVLGTDYAFEVWSVNPLGSSDRVSISPFVLEGPTAIEFPEVVAPEAERRTVANYTATDPEGDMVEWSLAGTDSTDFALSSDGQLTFRLDPNFEEPTDRNHPPDQEPPTDRAENNIYHLTVQARAGQQSAMLDMAVTVTDADDPGVISLSPPSPQVRMPLTAELTDEDGGILDARWQWQGQAPEATAWQPLSGTSSAGNQSSYTPAAAQVGWMLQAVVNPYRDALDAGKRAESMATEPVQAGVPDAPVLDALERNGRVSLIVRLGADNGSPITRTETRVYSVSKSDTTWRTTKGQWHSRSIDPTSWIYPTLFTSGQPVGWHGLTNGRTYQFEVRSVNGVGPSAIALTEATPGQTTRPTGALLPLTAWGEDGQVRLEWKPEPFWKVTRYEVQSRVARSGHGWPGWSAVVGGGSARDTTITGLLNGTEYEFMVRAVNPKGEPLAASNIVLARPASRPGELVLTASGGDGQVALSWTAAASNGSAIVRYEMQGRVANSGHGWPGWSAVAGGDSARDTTVAGLLNGTEYEFMVRAVNGVGASLAASATATPEGASTLAVSFGSATYAAQEGGAGVSIAVGLSPSSSQPVRIPVVVTADADTEAGDYTVAGLNAGAVVFAANETSQSFTITANEDADSDDETVSLSFGTLPAGVVAVGTTRQATVTLRDNDGIVPKPLAVRDLASRSTGLTSGQASWNPPSNALEAKVHSYRYRLDGGTIQSTTSTSASFSPLRSGRRYSVDVWAVGSSGAGPITTTTFITESGVAPVLDAVGPLTCYVGEYCSFTFPTASKGTAPITYKVSAPSWAKASGRSFSGTAPSSPGTASASLNASNAYGTDSESLTIKIKRRPVAGVAPVLDAVGPLTCYVGEYCSFTFPTASKGTAPITYKVSPPSWAKASGRSFSGTAPSSPGTASASLNASNSYGTDSESLTINIKRRPVVGVAPVLPSVSSITCYVGEYCSFTFPAASKGTSPITYKVSAPSWAKAAGRSFSGTAPSSPGTASASINASNAYGTDSESLTINVKKRPVAGVAPVLASVSSITCYVGEYCSFTFPAATSGTKPITYKVSAPSWAKTSGSRGFAGTAPSSPGTFSASLNASNSYGTDSESLTINVKKRGYPPVLASVSSITCYVGEYCSFTFPAATSGTSPITYKVSPPSWAKTSGSRGFAGAAPSSPGTFSVSINASNAYGTDSESLTIHVKRRLAMAPRRSTEFGHVLVGP